MKKIVMLPLDERPCNYLYPRLMPKAGYELVLPPKELTGHKKTPAPVEKLAAWLLENIQDADACILSLDMLVYGGIVPSRLHEEKTETLLSRAGLVKTLREKNPRMLFYVFQLIMRCPSYSSSDEEPDYYGEYGRDIHLYGRYTHLQSLGRLSEEDERDFARIRGTLPQEVLDDFLSRREKNLSVLLGSLSFAKEGIVDYFIVPQDDAAVFGFTSMDQMKVRKYLKENVLHMKTAMYPSADDTGLTLLCRAVSALNGVRPKIYVHYASCKAESVVPWFEDRPLGETVKYQIMAAGGRQVYSLAEAEILLAVNMGAEMCDETQPGYTAAYDVERNLAEFAAYIRYALEEGKIVAVGDVATCNGSDGELLRILRDEELLLRIHSYAGWNTSSNTLGTAICQAALYMIGRDEIGREHCLLSRYYEDMGYMSHTRRKTTDEILPPLGLDYFHTDGQNGQAAEAVKKELERYMAENFPCLSARVAEISVSMPWSRMFEIELKLRRKEG